MMPGMIPAQNMTLQDYEKLQVLMQQQQNLGQNGWNLGGLGGNGIEAATEMNGIGATSSNAQVGSNKNATSAASVSSIPQSTNPQSTTSNSVTSTSMTTAMNIPTYTNVHQNVSVVNDQKTPLNNLPQTSTSSNLKSTATSIVPISPKKYDVNGSSSLNKNTNASKEHQNTNIHVQTKGTATAKAPGPNLIPGKPLVALLDGKDCRVEMSHLKDIATVAFCGASKVSEIHENVLSDAFGLIVHQTITLTKKDLEQFKKCKIIVRVGDSVDNIDIISAAKHNILVSNVPSENSSENVANSTIALILNFYRSQFKLYNEITKPSTNKLNNPKIPDTFKRSSESVAKICTGSRNISGQILGIVGLGNIGSMVAVRAKVFGFRVIAYDPLVQKRFARVLGIEVVDSLEVSIEKKIEKIYFHFIMFDLIKQSVN